MSSNIPADWHEHLYGHYAECACLCEFPIENDDTCRGGHTDHACDCDEIAVERAEAAGLAVIELDDLDPRA
jgi:hypothetical protein